ncbi:MAG: divalent-cation tolerance protein CutA [Gammaproteobacteria bacterium]
MKNKEIIVFSTCPDPECGRALARSLVENRAAACVNVLPGVMSVYQWKGTTQEDSECLLMIKSTMDRMDSLASQIEELHPYELPEVVAVPVSGGLPAYLDWVRQSVTDGN